MNISDYSTKVKNLADAFAFIRDLVDDEDLVAVTLNRLGKHLAISYFNCSSRNIS
jgi:hypothetical protein